MSSSHERSCSPGSGCLVPFLTVMHRFPLKQEELKLELRQDFPTLTSHQNGEEKKVNQLEEENAKKSMN